VTLTGRFVHTLWCDDIRQEVGNKPSFMGVFTGGLLLPGVPATLSRLGVYTWIITPADRPFTSLQLSVIRDDGTVLAEIAPETAPPGKDQLNGEATRRQALVGVNMGPVEVPEGCRWFMVRVIADGERLDGPKLWISVSPEGFSASMSGFAPVPLESPASPSASE
jgi:hypothetical protein